MASKTSKAFFNLPLLHSELINVVKVATFGLNPFSSMWSRTPLASSTLFFLQWHLITIECVHESATKP
uniref:Uncharacterized protein n=1 Tax=Rhizophora mucronata TaxID=61149 RepID=A0A2P2IYZ8_RHIMU